MFARHAKRSTVTTDDVKLLARRSNSLLKYITEKNEEIAQLNLERKAKKKRKPEDENRNSREPDAEVSTDLRTAKEDGWLQCQRQVAVSLRAAAAALGGCSHCASPGEGSPWPGQCGEDSPCSCTGSCRREEERPPDFPCLVAWLDLPSQLQRPPRRGCQRSV
nr:uncharacterized protein LOC102904527 isoform X3 [Peromyscus maniculatus bairdii]